MSSMAPADGGEVCRASVLIVDDDDDVAELLAEVVQSLGHSVRVARDGKEGLCKIEEQLPDVVLLDVEMPKLTGPQMAYRMFITDVGKEQIPIILLSGAVNLRDFARQVGTPYYLAKPFDVSQLMSLLARALAERELPTPRL